MKILVADVGKIREALMAVNGAATNHVFRRGSEIQQIAQQADDFLSTISLSKKDRPGAVVVAASGDKVARAYKYSRVGTRVHLKRFPTGWFLTGVERVEIYTRGGFTKYILTPTQDEKVIAATRGKYTVDQGEVL